MLTQQTQIILSESPQKPGFWTRRQKKGVISLEELPPKSFLLIRRITPIQTKVKTRMSDKVAYFLNKNFFKRHYFCQTHKFIRV